MTNKVVFAAFLRGINVGGNNKVSMVELKVCFEKMGFEQVKTYINSGNVIFVGSAEKSEVLAKKVEAALHSTFKLPLSVVVKNLEELRTVVKGMPKNWHTATNLRLYVMFLRPSFDSADSLKFLNPKSEIEDVKYVPGALLWSVKLDALTRSDMMKVASKPIYKEMTIRNKNTTVKVYELMSQVEV